MPPLHSQELWHGDFFRRTQPGITVSSAGNAVVATSAIGWCFTGHDVERLDQKDSGNKQSPGSHKSGGGILKQKPRGGYLGPH
jgi:hypothetical protein